MSVNKNIICLDTETTGLDPESGQEVIEVCARALNYWDYEDHTAGVFHALIKPRRPELASKKALEVVGPLFDRAMTEGLDGKAVWTSFLEWCEKVNSTGKWDGKPIFVAYNVSFDSKFCKYHISDEFNLVKKNDFGPQLPWSYEFDAMQMAWHLFESHSDIANLKLNTILDKLMLKRANADVHTALEDVELMTQFVKRSLKFFRTASKKMVMN